MEMTLVKRSGDASSVTLPLENYVLEESSLIKLEGNLSDIKSAERQGLNLILTLSSGKKLFYIIFIRKMMKVYIAN